MHFSLKKALRFLKTTIKIALNKAVTILFKHIKSDEKSVICGGWFGQRFADNSKAIFLFLAQNKELLGLSEVIFVTKDRNLLKEIKKQGYTALHVYSLLSIKKHLQSKYHIVDQAPVDINRLFSVNSLRINLWHGFPLKKIGSMVDKSNLDLKGGRYFRQQQVGNWHDFLTIATSTKHQELLAKSFLLNKNRVVIGVYPRIAYMLGIIDSFYLTSEKEAVNKIKKAKHKKKQIIGYFPTFRDLDEHNKTCIKTIEKLNHFAKSHNCLILTKLHFASNTSFNFSLEHILNLPPEADLYNFINETDILITDYSSIYFDFLIYNRPILFYCFDYEYYLTQDRGFNFDYSNFTPGKKCKTFKELSSSLTSALLSPQDYQKKYKKQHDYVIKTVYNKKINYSFRDMIDLWKSLRNCTG